MSAMRDARWMILAAGLAGATPLGCAALGNMQQSAGSGLDAAKGAKDGAGGAMDQAKQAKDLLKGGGGGAATPGGDPDNDGLRSQAKESKANEPITDEIDPMKNDKADWKMFPLEGKPGMVTVQIHWDDPAADLAIDLYDAMGANIAASPPRGNQPAKRLLARIDETGNYYVKVSSVKGSSVYTVMAKWAGPSGGGSKHAAAAPAPAAGGSSGGAAAPAGAGGAAAADPDHPRARILQSYRDDDGQMVLYIDKGSAAGVRGGMSGFILEGGDGDNPLAGGEFKIFQVVGPGKSIAHSSVAKVGKNTRCVINLR
jgi:hypothetical protein